MSCINTQGQENWASYNRQSLCKTLEPHAANPSPANASNMIAALVYR